MFKQVQAGLMSALLLGPVLAGCQATASTAGQPSTSVATAPAASSAPSAAPNATAAWAAVSAGPRPPGPVPPRWGPAANGLVLYGTTTGEIRSIDIADRDSHTLMDGASDLAGATSDGKRMVFERKVDGRPALWIADIDGTDARQLLDPAASAGWDWIEGAPDAHRIVMLPAGGGDLTIFDFDSGSKSIVHAPVPIREASWLADGRLLVVSGGLNGDHAVFGTIAEDGTGYTVVPTTDAIEHYSISGEGTRFAYDSWGKDPGTQGLIHVVDLASGTETLLTKPDANFSNLLPVFSPDGRWVAADRLDSVGSRIVLYPAGGKGKPVELGPEQKGDVGEPTVNWAPDASALLVTYPDVDATWLLDVASAKGTKVDWPGLGDRTSWQRVAP